MEPVFEPDPCGWHRLVQLRWAWFLAALVVLGRFSVPGHALTGWPGVYEFLAHAWVGGMLMLWWSRGHSLKDPLVGIFWLAALFELVMFLTR